MLEVLVNSALAVAVDGRALNQYPLEVLRQTRGMRKRLGHGAVGDKYLNRNFATVAIIAAEEL